MKKYITIKSILLALAFVVVAGIIFITAGTPMKTLAMTKINMAVDLGAPVYDYTGQSTQPDKGELIKEEVQTPSMGSRYGTIICDSIEMKAPLYYGDTDYILSKGAGQYAASSIPGEGFPVLIGAHDLGYFAPLESIEEDDIIEVNTSYGEFKYKVTDIEVKAASSYGKSELETPGEELILYTCYPFGSLIRDSADRYFVTAVKISGPVFVEK